jgi:LmbE family N-acetylglucosaminyl deacetylase
MSRPKEQQAAAAMLGVELCWGGFDDGAIPDGAEAIAVIDAVLAASGADILYAHAVEDTHQDHRATATASIAAGRRLPTVLQFETPSSQHFEPSVYVDVADTIEEKLAALRAHLSQVLRPGPVELEAIEAQARFRGFHGRVRYAEAFETTRLAWDLAAPSPASAVPALALAASR